MKKLLYSFVFFFINHLGIAQVTTATQTFTLVTSDGTGTPYEIQFTRNLGTYPLDATGLSNVKKDMLSGNFNLTVKSKGTYNAQANVYTPTAVFQGCIIAKGTRPGIAPPTVCSPISSTAPSWIAGFRYSYDSNQLLTLEGAGQIGTLTFSGVSGFPTNNPDGVLINANQAYMPGQLTGQGNFDKQWQLYYKSSSAIQILAAQSGVASTFTYNFTPTPGANRVALTGNTTTPPSSTTTTPPSSTTTATVANGLPIFETFNYQPITSNPDSWDGYDSRVNQDGPIGKYATLSNGTITVRVMGDQGGTPSFIASNSDNLNRINLHDLGTQNGQTLYRDGAISPYPNPVVHSSWSNIGNDPIQMGNVFGQKSEVVAMGRTADMIYTKTHMRNWPVKDEYTDVYLEQWVTLDGIGAPVYTKITFNRTDDKSFQAFRAHEFPTFYSVGSMRTLAYIGENGGINYTANQAGQFDISIAKNWIALAKSASPSAQAIGLTAPGLYFTTQWQHAIGDSKAAPNEDLGNEKGYSAWRAFFHTDWNQVFYSKHTWVVGTVQQIKDYAEAKTDPRNKIAWKFNSRNGRGFWVHKNGIDEGFPTNNDGIEITKQGSGEFYIQAPYMAIPASSVSNIYLRYKSSGFSSTWSLNYNKVNQQDGAALNNGQTINFNTVNDNQWHTVTIPVNGQWQNTIQKLRFSNDGAANGSKIKIAWINTVDADPEP